MGTPGSPSPPPSGPTVNIFCVDNRAGRRRVDPHLQVRSLSRGGPGVTVGILQTGHPYKQALNQDKELNMHPRATTCPTVPDPASQLRCGLVLPRVQ
jgi:hypothetical protein